MKNVLKVVSVIIGTLIGAGFASGQEMYIFFFSYGIRGIVGILISSILMGTIIYKTLKIIEERNIVDYKNFVDNIIKNKSNRRFLNIKYVFNIIVNLFILITFFIMIAGFGAYIEQTFKINSLLASSLFAGLTFIVFMQSVKGLVKANEIIIPILVTLIIIIGIINIKGIDFYRLSELIPRTNFSNWVLSSILYCSYNSIILVPTLITLRNYIKNKKQIFLVSAISVGIIICLSIIIFLLLINLDVEFSTVEMPIIYVVSKMFDGFKMIYGFIIVGSIFTTSISLGTSFLQNTSKNKKSYTQIAVIMCITSIMVSKFGFSNLVNLLYPIFGYLGILQIFTMFCR